MNKSYMSEADLFYKIVNIHQYFKKENIESNKLYLGTLVIKFFDNHFLDSFYSINKVDDNYEEILTIGREQRQIHSGVTDIDKKIFFDALNA